MPFYHVEGKIPAKRHSVYQRPGGGLVTEELMGNEGFTGLASLVYHLEAPTEVVRIGRMGELAWEAENPARFGHRHFRTAGMVHGPSATLDRVPLLLNHDVALSVAAPSATDDFWFRNAQGDEVIYVAEGEGVLETPLGEIAYRGGDYLVIPRGILYKLRLGAAGHRLLIIQSSGHVRTPKRYRNGFGQLTEGAPYSERDFRLPVLRDARHEQGEFRIVVKQHNALHEVVVRNHPLDIVGWDGYYFPYALSIHDFEPRVGRFHLPPPVHQTFEGDGFVVCSFCPRPYDFDVNAVPAPYNHSNVMSDEVLYYANSEFMSRSGIEYGSVTLHPDGIPHGPQPGRTEASIGKKWTDELAVMVDTFRGLHVAQAALGAEDEGYWSSWRKE